MTLKRILLLCTTLALALFFAAPPASAEPVKVRYMISPIPLYAIPIVAKEKGFFEKQGLDVEFVTYNSGKKGMKGLFEGEVDIVTSSKIPVVTNSFTHDDYKIIATMAETDDGYFVLYRKDRGIEKPEDLKGKTIATLKGSGAHYYLHLYLLHNGMKDSDVNIVFKSFKELAPALLDGEVDAMCLWNPIIDRTLAKMEGNGATFNKYNMYRKNVVIVASNNLIDADPATVEKLLAALVQAEEYIYGNPDESYALVGEKIGATPARVKMRWEEYDFKMTLYQALLIGLEDVAQWAIQSGLNNGRDMPNYLDFIYTKGLETVRPDSVTIVR